MAQHQALILPTSQGKLQVGTVPTPKPGHDEVVVKVLSTGLNPIDWKIQKYGVLLQDFPAILGTDAAGEIVEVGSNVTTFKKGDKVVNEGWLETPLATFQQYLVVPAEIVAKIPANITVDEAATLPVGIATAAIGFYQQDVEPIPFLVPDGKPGLGLTPPWVSEGRGKYKGTPIVIFGGSSTIGQFAIQFAKLSGFNPVITTCSPKHEDYVKSLGASHVVNRSGNTVAEIQKLLPGGRADYAYDSISTAETQAQALQVVSEEGWLLLTLALEEGLDVGKKNVRKTFGSVRHLRKLGVELYAALPGLLESGDIKPTRVEVLPNGLAGIVDGLARMAADQVSGVKLVAKPWE